VSLNTRIYLAAALGAFVIISSAWLSDGNMSDVPVYSIVYAILIEAALICGHEENVSED